jgi:hypothetical protein
MYKRSVRWGADIGLQSRIKPLNPSVTLAEHGLKGARAQGELDISRTKTRQVAKEDAEDGIPASEALTQDQWSEREQLIAERAESVRTGLITWMSATAGSVRNFIQDCTPGEINPQSLQEAIKAEEEDYRGDEADEATDAAAQHAATVIELNDFRAAHGERIGSRTPDIKKNVEQAFAILLFVMIVEGCFNALLFKDAQSGGMMGGMMVAFGVSAANVLFGVTAGYFGLRYLNHPRLPFKVMGGVVAALAIGAGIFTNFFVAHFRDAVEQGLIAAEAAGTLNTFSMFDIPPGTAVASMFPNPFGFDSLVALGLLLIGFVVFAVAVYEGYDRISDRYPGYGRVWRKERLAYEHRQSVRHDVRDDLSDYFTRCREWFETQHSRHTSAKREIEKAMNILDTRRDQAMAIARKAGEQERSLKIAYRQAHRRARNAAREKLGEQAAIPAYFDEIITPNLPPFDFSREREQANGAIAEIDNNLTALNITREWLEGHIQRVQQGLSSIDKKVAEELSLARAAREGTEQKKRSA